MNRIICILIMFLFFHNCYSQDRSYPSPAIGWDSLKSLIKFPKIEQRAALEGVVIVRVDVFSIGEIKNIKVYGGVNDFERTVKETLQNIKWIPAIKDGKPIESTVRFPIFFTIKEKWTGPRIFIEVEPDSIRANY